MGFLGPIPASKLAAEYDPETQSLKLFAEGTIQIATYGIKFGREPWVGGLKFSLEGWTGPLTGKTAPYTHEQSFKIHLPDKVYPSNYVIIVDGNNFKGIPVPIRWVSGSPPGGLPDHADKPGADKPGDAGPEESVLPVLGEIVLNVLYQEPFTIQQPAEMPKFGSIDIKFDEGFLSLKTAGINDGNIAWTFDPLQTGNTQIIVTFRGGIATYVHQVKYDVNVFILPLEPGPVILPTNDDNGLPAILSYLGRVNIARRIVEAKYPGAALYNVHAKSLDPHGVTSPYLLTHMTVIFRDLKGNGTIIITSPGYKNWGPIVYEKHGIVGNADVPWPVGMDADEADKILKKEGHTGPYTDLTLLRPLYPGGEETYYQFRMVTGREVWIGVKGGKISFDGPASNGI